MEPQTGGTGDLRQELRGDAQKVTHSAKERVQGELDARKGMAAEQAHSLSSALHAAADELGSDSPNWLRSAFEQGSQTLQRFAETVEQKDSRQLTRDVQQLAREHPGTFMATCALVGFAAARVFKAGGAGSNGGAGSYQPYAGESGSAGAGGMGTTGAGSLGGGSTAAGSTGAASYQSAPNPYADRSVGTAQNTDQTRPGGLSEQAGGVV